jgi:gluconolactonase
MGPQVRRFFFTLLLGLFPGGAALAAAQAPADPPAGRPDAIVDLASKDGAALVGATWRYRDAKLVEVASRAPGPDLRPSGAPIRAIDISPGASEAFGEDPGWERIAPDALETRRGNSKVSFAWYRLDLTLPERVGGTAIAGSTVAFEVVVDDYAEVWVDGKLPLVLGQTGGPVVKGFNAPNRVIVAQDARPGQHIRLAVFAINGPLSASPNNFIWIRSATLEVHRASTGPRDELARVLRVDPAIDTIVPRDTRIEKLAQGFLFTEGPVWHPDGYLLFSDPNANAIYRWSPSGQVSVYRAKSGYKGADVGEYGQPGSNGLTLDAEGRLTINEHGNRRVTRLEKNGSLTVLADRYQGKRLNSPNDLVYRSDGALYFTDPPFGLPKAFDDKRKELPYSGVFCLKDGKLELVSTDLTGPNGIAFSPDERFLYVTNWDLKRKVVMRYEVHSKSCELSNGRVFFDMTSAPGGEALDGMKVDREGLLFVSGPGGVWVISPEGKHLGTIQAPELPANMAFGDADGRTLYLAARTGVYRIRLSHEGVRPPLARASN